MERSVKYILIGLFFSGFLISECLAQSDIKDFYLKDGTIIQGKVIAQDDSIMVVDTQYGTIEIQRNNIIRMEQPKESQIKIKKSESTTIYLTDGTTIKGVVTYESEDSLSIETDYGVMNISKLSIKGAEGGFLSQEKSGSINKSEQVDDSQQLDQGRFSMWNRERINSVVQIGTRIRLSSLQIRQLIGSVVAIDDTFLTIFQEDHSPLKVTLNSIIGIEICVGESSHTLEGLAIGAGLGALLGLTVAPVNPNPTLHELESGVATSRGAAVVAGIFAFGITGAIIGWLIKSDDWFPIHVEAKMQHSVLDNKLLMGVQSVLGYKISISYRYAF